ncbi:MAG: NfeD family protein [Pseudomonadota bacterium]
MIASAVSNLGPWSWVFLGFLMLGLEMIVPGILLMWFGFAALIIGGLSLLAFTDVATWSWQVQIIAYCVLSGALAYTGTRLFPSSGKSVPDNGLEDTLSRFHGAQTELLDTDGDVDRVRLGDTVWRVRKTGHTAGTKVRVIKDEDGLLIVEALD